MPEPLRGKPLLTIDGACIGSQEEGEAAIAPLREIGEPMMDTFDPDARRRAQPDPHGPGEPGARARRRHDARASCPTRRSTPSSAVAGADSGSPLLLTELRHVGGALGRPAENGGALSHLDAGFVDVQRRHADDPELGEAITAHLDRSRRRWRPWAADGGYFNFTERPCTSTQILPADVCARLGEVKREVGPRTAGSSPTTPWNSRG